MSDRYDLLVVDLDGTLLDRRGGVSAGNRAALDQARDAGLDVVVATGRSIREARPSLDALEYDGPVIAAGGSLLCDAASGRTLERHVLPREIGRIAAGHLVNHGHKALLLKDVHAAGFDYLAVGPAALDPASEWWFEALGLEVQYVDTADEDTHPDDTLRAGVVAPAEQLADLVTMLRDEFADEVLLQHWPAVTASHCIGAPTHLLEIFRRDTDKWTMVTAYCRVRSIDPDRVVAIGDGLNDVQMVARAGLGVAMGNAMEPVLAVADRVTGHHEADGVALAIDRLLAGTW